MMRGLDAHRSTDTPRLALLCVTTVLVSGALGCGSAVSTTTTGSNPVPVAAANGPQLGYVWNATEKSLRPILGIAGSSQLGQSVVTPGAYLSAATSATASFAVAQAVDGTIDLLALPSGTATLLKITAAAGAIIRLSPSGSSAFVYAPGSSTASLVSGLPTAPLIHSVPIQATFVDAAVSDAGSAAVELAQGSTLSAEVIGSNGETNQVATLKGAGGMSFLPASDSLLLADASANTLKLISSASTSPGASTLSASGLLRTPSALGVSPSGRWALVVNGSGNTLVRVDLAHATSSLVSCACTPTLAAPLAEDGAFRVTNATTGPNWVIDSVPATPRVLFIPALPQPSSATLSATVRS